MISPSPMSDSNIPLPERLRPRDLSEIIGQDHLLGEQAPLRQMIDQGHLPSIIFWGPPGVGKTTIALLLAQAIDRPFVSLSALNTGVKELREIIADGGDLMPPVVFIDEIHRFNKSQQDALLNAVEKGKITLIGATTENPSFEVISALLSRCQVYILESLGVGELNQVLQRAIHEDETFQGQARRCPQSVQLNSRLCAHHLRQTAPVLQILQFEYNVLLKTDRS